jgi:hypothetical protein
MGDPGRIDVHLATAAGSKLIGSIPAFNNMPPRDMKEMNLGGITVKLGWHFDRVASIGVQSMGDAAQLKSLGFEPANLC